MVGVVDMYRRLLLCVCRVEFSSVDAVDDGAMCMLQRRAELSRWQAKLNYTTIQ